MDNENNRIIDKVIEEKEPTKKEKKNDSNHNINITIIIMAIGCLCIIFGIVMNLFSNEDNGGNGNSSNDRNIVLNGDMTLESTYRREVIKNAQKYISDNNITESTEIDTTTIVQEERFSTCSGKLIYAIENENYIYSTDVVCGNKTKGREVEYKLFDGNLSNVFAVEDGIIVVSKSDIQNENYNSVLTMFNDSGEKLWSLKYDKPNKDGIANQINVATINSYKDNYLVTIEYTKGNDYASVNSKAFLVNKKGKIEKEINLTNNGSSVNLIYDFINEDNGKMYFLGDINTSDGRTEIPAIIVFDNSKVSFIEYEGNTYNGENVTTRNVLFVKNGNIYGNSIINVEATGEIISQNTVFKMDKKGKVLIEKEIPEITSNAYINALYITEDNSIYISYADFSEEYGLVDKGIYELSSNLELKSVVSFNELLSAEQVQFHSFSSDNNLLQVILIDAADGSKYSILTLNKKYEVQNKIDISTENVLSMDFEQKDLYKNIISENRMIQVYYTAADDFSLNLKNIILVFYK